MSPATTTRADDRRLHTPVGAPSIVDHVLRDEVHGVTTQAQESEELLHELERRCPHEADRGRDLRVHRLGVMRPAGKSAWLAGHSRSALVMTTVRSLSVAAPPSLSPQKRLSKMFCSAVAREDDTQDDEPPAPIGVLIAFSVVVGWVGEDLLHHQEQDVLLHEHRDAGIELVHEPEHRLCAT